MVVHPPTVVSMYILVAMLLTVSQGRKSTSTWFTADMGVGGLFEVYAPEDVIDTRHKVMVLAWLWHWMSWASAFFYKPDF